MGAQNVSPKLVSIMEVLQEEWQQETDKKGNYVHGLGGNNI